MIKVLFFAGLRDQLGVAELQLAAQDNPDINSLLENLKGQGDSWHRALNNNRVLVAVNQNMSTTDSLLQDGDEVAFFPPVTGG